MLGKHSKLFKFVTDDGLFYNGLDQRHTAQFVTEGGIEYLTEANAREAWRQYEFHRLARPAEARPKIKMVTYRLIIEEIASEDFSEGAAQMRLTAVTEVFGVHDGISKFVRSLYKRDDFMDFKFIVLRSTDGLNRTRRADEIDLTAVPGAVLSSRKTLHRYIAVKSPAELVYVRMALGAKMKSAVDIDTATYVIGDDYDRE